MIDVIYQYYCYYYQLLSWIIIIITIITIMTTSAYDRCVLAFHWPAVIRHMHIWARELSHDFWGTPRTAHLVKQLMNNKHSPWQCTSPKHCVLLNPRKSHLTHARGCKTSSWPLQPAGRKPSCNLPEGAPMTTVGNLERSKPSIYPVNTKTVFFVWLISFNRAKGHETNRRTPQALCRMRDGTSSELSPFG